MIPILDVEDEPDRHANVHAPILVIAYPDDTSEEEEDGMALNKGNKSLQELMAARHKVSMSKDTNKPQVPANLPPPLPLLVTSFGLIPYLDLKKKRKVPEVHDVEEGKMVPLQGAKQPKHTKDKRASSMESREDSQGTDVRQPP